MIEYDNQPRWYCLKTQTRREMVAKNGIANDVGVEVFCPRLRFERATKSGKRIVTEAMFPGYLFARFGYLDHYRHVASVNGVRHFVSFGGRPAWVSDQVIAELREVVNEKEIAEIPISYEEGKEIEVIGGAFSGIRAVITKVLPGRHRVAILLEILGMEREVEVEVKDIITAPGDEPPGVAK